MVSNKKLARNRWGRLLREVGQHPVTAGHVKLPPNAQTAQMASSLLFSRIRNDNRPSIEGSAPGTGSWIPAVMPTRGNLALNKAFVIIDRQDPYRGKCRSAYR